MAAGGSATVTTNGSDSSAGTLLWATGTLSGTGGTVGFSLPTGSNTIQLGSDVTLLSVPYTFTNNTTTGVTVNLGGYSVRAGAGDLSFLGSNVTWETSSTVSSGNLYGVYGNNNTLSIGTMSSVLAVSATGTSSYASGIYASGVSGSVSIGDIAGTVSVKSSGAGGLAYGVSANKVSMDNLSGNVNATADGNAYGVYGASSGLGVQLSNVSGSILSESTGTGAAYGVYTNGSATLSGVGGSIKAVSVSGEATAIDGSTGVSLSGTTSGVVAAVSGSGMARGVYGSAITVDNLTGTISGSSSGVSAQAYGIEGGSTVYIAQSSGMILANGGQAWAVYSNGYLSVGTSTGVIVARGSGNSAYGLYSETGSGSLTSLAGTVAAYNSGTGSADAIYAYSNVAIGTSTALIASSASSGNAYGIQAYGGSVSADLLGGTISAISTGSGSSTMAVAIYSTQGVNVTYSTATVLASGVGAVGIYSNAGDITIGTSTSTIAGSATSRNAYGIESYIGNATVGNLGGLISATTSGDSATSVGIYAYGDIQLGSTGGVGGTITGMATGSSDTAHGVYSQDGSVSITNLTGLIGVQASGSRSTATGIEAHGDIVLGGTTSGSVIAVGTSSISSAYAITSSSGSIYVANLSGTISAASDNDVIAIDPALGNAILSGTTSGLISASSLDYNAAAIDAQAGSVSINYLSGTISAYNSGSSLSNAQSVVGGQGVSIGTAKGVISAQSDGGNAYAVGSLGAISIGTVSGRISAVAKDLSEGVMTYSGNVGIDVVSGTISAASTMGEAYAINVMNGSVGGSSTNAMLVTGKISATGAIDAYAINATSGIDINIAEGGLVDATASGDAKSGGANALFTAGTLSAGTIAGTVSAVSANGFSNAILGSTSIAIGNLSGVVVASGDAAFGVYSEGSLSITNLSGSVNVASTTGFATGIETYSSSPLTITNLSGCVSATSDSGDVSAIYASSGSVSITNFTGSLSGVATSGSAAGIFGMSGVDISEFAGTVNVSGTLAAGVAAGYGNLSIGTMTGYIGSTASNVAYGIANLTGDVSVTSLGGTVAAVSTGSSSEVAAITASGNINISSASGSIIAQASGDSTDVYGIHSSAGSISVASFNGSVTTLSESSENDAKGVFAKGDVVFGKMAGSIVVQNGYTAYGISSGAGNVVLNDFSGSISVASGSATGLGIKASGNIDIANMTGKIVVDGSGAAGIFSSDGGVSVNMAGGAVIDVCSTTSSPAGAVAIGAATGASVSVASGATVSATSGGGTAYAINVDGGNSSVSLAAGCVIVGDISLGGAADTLALTGTTGSTRYTGNISGAENFLVKGGYWNLTGSVTGVTNFDVTGGTIAMNGTMDSGTVSVASGAVLGGTATLANLVNYGTLSPGNSIGTINITGDYVNAAGSNVNIQINNTGSSDKINVGGTAFLQGGTVNVLGGSGSYVVNSTYTFLTAGSVAGTYAGVTDDLAFLNAVLVYGSDYVEIVLRSGKNFEDEAATPNQHVVARVLDANKNSAVGDFAVVIDDLNALNGVEARQAFDAMSGELYGSLATVGIEAHEQFVRSIAQRLQAQAMTLDGDEFAGANSLEKNLSYCSRHTDESALSTGWMTWAQGYGVGSNMASDGNASGLKYSTGGMLVGVERLFGGETKVGLVGGYSSTNLTLDDRGDNGSVDGGQAAVYLHRDFEQFYLSGIAAYGYNSYATTRYIDFGSLDRTAHANYGGNNYSFYTEAGKTIYGQRFNVQPYAGLEYIGVHQNDFAETGANSIDIVSGGEQAQAFRGMLGTRLVSTFHTETGRVVTLEGRAAWRHEFLNDSRVLDASYDGVVGSSFAIAGDNIDRDMAILGIGTTYQIRTGFSVFASYDINVSENYTAHTGAGGIQYQW